MYKRGENCSHITGLVPLIAGMEYGKMGYGLEWNMEWNGGMEYGMDGECTVNHVNDALLSLG